MVGCIVGKGIITVIVVIIIITIIIERIPLVILVTIVVIILMVIVLVIILVILVVVVLSTVVPSVIIAVIIVGQTCSINCSDIFRGPTSLTVAYFCSAFLGHMSSIFTSVASSVEPSRALIVLFVWSI